MKWFGLMERGAIDFVLAFASTAVTTFALGMALSYPPLGYFFMGVNLFGTFVAYAVYRRWKSPALLRLSYALYAILAFASPFVGFFVNDYLPGEGFPRELLLSAATLSWMVALGSFAAWRDQTLLFQSVPCIALFGLVGAFNTFAGATVTFFVFMISTSLLYARSHQRGMLERAVRSGYPKVETIHAGPWRWMAGPEWGIVSAAVVIVLSIISAPILQFSVKTVSGTILIRPPQVQPPATPASVVTMATGEGVRVGTGPRGRISDKDIFHAELPEPRYLRIGVFGVYDRGGWRRSTASLVQVSEQQLGPDESMIPYLRQADMQKNFSTASFKVRFTDQLMPKLPVPTPFVGLYRSGMVDLAADGSVTILRARSENFTFAGTFLRRDPRAQPGPAPTKGFNLRPWVAIDGIHPSIARLARDVAAGPQTDFDKAIALKREIEQRAKYNLNAEAAPADRDPVEYFLFGDRREGYCDLFASSMVLMARSAGIPARYVVGYYPINQERDEEGWFILREADAHAWAELYFEGVGWIPFDATEGAEMVPGGERGSARDAVPFYQLPWFVWTLYGLAGTGVAGAMALIARSWRVTLTPEQVQRARLGAAYEQFVDALERATGEGKYAPETPDEYFHRVQPKLGRLAPEAAATHTKFVELFYGPDSYDPETIESLSAAAFQLRKGARDARRAAEA